MTTARWRFRPIGAPRDILLMLSAAVALAACGGGGTVPVPEPHPGGHAAAATATPIPGSVTQSSLVSNGVTAQPVTTTIESDGSGGLTPVVRSEGWQMANQPAEPEGEIDIKGTKWQVFDQTREYGDGSKRFVRTLTNAVPENFSDDYLVMGYWLRVPERWVDEDGNIRNYGPGFELADFYKEVEYGGFVNGGDPYEQDNIRALTGTATYRGGATGWYIDTINEKGSALRAAATFTADFGGANGLGTVTGRVHDFESYGDGPAERRELNAAELGQLEVILEQADIGNLHSGFFTGDTSMTVGGDNLAGKWGGQFYGNGPLPSEPPKSVAGTFGAANEGQTKAIVGTFGAANR